MVRNPPLDDQNEDPELEVMSYCSDCEITSTNYIKIEKEMKKTLYCEDCNTALCIVRRGTKYGRK